MRILLAIACTIGSTTVVRGEMITVAHPESKWAEASTVVWSPVFQATWDKLTEQVGAPVRIEPPNELMAKLDSFKFDPESTLPAGSWKVWSGTATPEFLTQVNKEAAKITGEEEGPFTLTAVPEDVLGKSAAAFGLLDRKLEFKKPLYRSSAKSITFRAADKETAAQFFGSAGALSGEYGGMIRVLSHDPAKNTHALELGCKEEGESVVLFLPDAAMTFSKACEEIRQMKAGFDNRKGDAGSLEDPYFHGKDVLKVPYISLKTAQSFQELMDSVRFCGDPTQPWKIGRAEQVTRFELDEKGARVRVETSLQADPFGSPPEPVLVPRSFIYDRPFFILLWKEGAEWPYFGAWIGDSSALKPFL